MGQIVAPPYDPRDDAPAFPKPPEFDWWEWKRACTEVMAECPPPYGLYLNPDAWIIPRAPLGKPETH